MNRGEETAYTVELTVVGTPEHITLYCPDTWTLNQLLYIASITTQYNAFRRSEPLSRVAVEVTSKIVGFVEE